MNFMKKASYQNLDRKYLFLYHKLPKITKKISWKILNPIKYHLKHFLWVSNISKV